MAMHSTTLTRCLRTTPLSLFRQQMPKQPRQLSLLSANTTRAYSTNPSPPQENDESEKPAEKEAAADGDKNNNNSTEKTTTTSSSTNTETSPAHDLVSEAQTRTERTKQLLDSLRIKSPMSGSGNSNPPTNLKQSLKGLTKGLRELNAKPKDPVLARDFTKSIVPEFETKKPDEQQSPSLRTVANRISPILDRKPKPMIKTVPLKLGPKLGRQIMVQNDRGMDCASAIRTLEVSCRSNNLRRQEQNQRFHVRRGQARKNLRIQRWRKLFKVSFLATVRKIDRMRDQGW
ncbi:uncharacterized protein TRUGW13939_01873 [Talaromyces rugulosus]|uniref:Ribosomal protein S21 n=1 Tax=Talaromyces rugulosus TaxID=121627 RepID=A0A7H8QLN8_TALRU|nr:uncharacterized protein TRUGW13939_01873 [Talaromyces rugulosus]QKX54784.1 hypothetical protein TRUGW13939_01873 [Talaromyces rugulosus]